MVGMEGGGAVVGNAKLRCGGDGIHVGAQEDELPAIFAFLVLNHLADFVVAEFTAGIFQTVGGDHEHHMFGAFVFGGVLLGVTDLVDGFADRIQQGGAAAHKVFVFGDGGDPAQGDAVMQQLIMVIK